MTVYISGPITTDPEHAEKFAAAFATLSAQGHAPINPVDIGRALKLKMGREPTRYEYMREDIKAMMGCDAICILPDWIDSWGACIELELANRLHFEHVHL
jgi:nucleoside 2-deoxyribosyltransferase